MALLAGKPLLQWAIEGAKKSGLFDKIVVNSDWISCLKLAEEMGVRALLRPETISHERSHDYEFVEHTLDQYYGYDIFAILRPTSPFRTAETIARAMGTFKKSQADSLRAVELTRHHPHKSWRWPGGSLMWSYLPEKKNRKVQDYDLPTQVFPEIYCQNGCIHIAKTEVIEKYGNVTGKKIAPFITIGREGLDINTKEDLEYAEWLIETEKVC